jgi:3-methyl-2-oxobutanoate hydroxymethyltransferase
VVKALFALEENQMAEAIKKLTIFDLQEKVDRGEKIFQVTAVDYPTGQLVDRAGIDCILIGDSLGMTALGYSGTVPVTMDEMIHHAKAISRAVKRALLVGDLPLGAYHASTADAVNSAMRMVKEGGADVVKLEGGEDFAPMAEAVVRAGIPVMAHIGLTPQLVSKIGGYKVQGKSAETGVQLLKDALAMERAGCFAIVLEAIPDRVAQVITERLKIPTIGIGAGPNCDGQNLVLHDMVGLFDRFTPKFVKRYANCWEIIGKALADFQDDVRKGTFPSAEHSFTMKDDEYQALLQQIPKK